MKRTWFLSIVFGVVIIVLNQPVASEQRQSLQKVRLTSVDQIFSLKDEQFTLLDAILIAEKEMKPDIDMQKYRKEIHDLAVELYQKLNYYRRLDDPVDYMETFLSAKGYSSSASNVFFFSEFLDTKKGDTVLLSLLYLVMAEKLHVPMYAVDLPSRFFVRYENGSKKINIDVSESKGRYTDRNHIAKHSISKSAIEKGLYLRNLSKRETLAQLFYLYSQYYFITTRYQRALEVINTGIHLHPLKPEFYYQRAELYSAIKDYDKAMDDINTVVLMDPSQSYVYYLAANICIIREDFDKAAEYVDKIHVVDNSNNLIMKGLYYENIGDYDNALSAMKKSLQFNPDDPNSYYHIAKVYAKKKDYASALKAIDRAIRFFPNYHTYHYDQATYHLYNKSLEEAKESIEKALQYQPDNPDYLLLQKEITNALKGNLEGNTMIVPTNPDDPD